MVTRSTAEDNDLTIRRHSTGEDEIVRELHERSLKKSPMEFIEDVGDEKDLHDVSKHYINSGGEFLVGLIDGDIIATGGYQPESDDTVQMRRLRVHPDYQRRGFGEQVLEALEERATLSGYTRIILNTHTDLTAAQNLYISHDYEEIRRKPHPVTGETMIFFEKEL